MDGSYDVIVIGSGAAGLAATLRCAERGAKVLLLERLTYPGGCAGTFRHQDASFPAGATLMSPVGPDDWLPRWMEAHHSPLRFHVPEVPATFRTHRTLTIAADRRRTAQQFARTGDPGPIRDFFAYQRDAADALWPLVSSPDALPSFHLAFFRRAPKVLPFLRWWNKPLTHVMAHFGVDRHPVLRPWVDAVCQIAVQCPADEADALFGLAALDYFFRRAGHPVGGVGAWADAMVAAIRLAGGQVELACGARRLTRSSVWNVFTRKGTFRAPVVLGNVLPGAMERLTGVPGPTRIQDKLVGGWSAGAWFFRARWRGDFVPHHNLVLDPTGPMWDGNHVFVSVGEPDEDGVRSVSATTHVKPKPSEAHMDAVRFAMRRTIRERLPELHILSAFPASPSTFARFTGRPGGLVGGIPRRVGATTPRDLFPSAYADGLHLIGDSFFPGQGVTVAALGGVRAVERILR